MYGVYSTNVIPMNVLHAHRIYTFSLVCVAVMYNQRHIFESQIV